MNGRGSALVGEVRFTFIDKARLGMMAQLLPPLLTSLAGFSVPDVSISSDDRQLSPLGFLQACLSWLLTAGTGKTIIIGVVFWFSVLIVVGLFSTASIRRKRRIEGQPVGPLSSELGSAIWILGALMTPIIGVVLGGLLLLYVGYILFWVFSHPS